jgi:hypothetical protein
MRYGTLSRHHEVDDRISTVIVRVPLLHINQRKKGIVAAPQHPYENKRRKDQGVEAAGGWCS